MTTVRCLSLSGTTDDGWSLSEVDVPLAELRSRLSRTDGPTLWLDLVQDDGPVDGAGIADGAGPVGGGAASEVAEALGLRRTEIEGILGRHARAKAVHHADHLAFIVYAPVPVGEAVRAALGGDPEAPEEEAPQPRRGEDQFRATRIAGFVHPGGVVTVRSDDAFDLSAVREAWAEDEGAPLGASGLAHLVLDDVVDAQFWAAQWMDDRLDDLEDDVFEAAGRSAGIETVAAALRGELTRLRRWIQPMASVIDRLRPETSEGRGSTAAAPGPERTPPPAHPGALELRSLHAELADHAARTEEWLDSQHETLTSVVQTHLALQDQRLNVVMRKLAGWAAVVSIPTLVTGWFGINVPYPGFGSPVGLAIAAVLVLVPTLAVGVLMRRARWI
ncbi:CorA family divalent cation transporter [Brachybacterium sp. NPDC056505]|uniref:CorA family divalent cation transporter n=1 Tax=Brachybacterium sp. NPDC056505 TaxID=3345843 RepID=UPI00366FE5D4